MENRVAAFGEQHMIELINGLPWKYPPHDLSYDGIMAADKPPIA